MARQVNRTIPGESVGWQDPETGALEVHARGIKTTTLCGKSWAGKLAWIAERRLTCETCIAVVGRK